MYFTEDCNCLPTIFAASATVIFVIIVIVICDIVVIVLCKKRGGLHVDPGAANGTVRDNPAVQSTEQPASDDRKEKSSTPVSPEPTAEHQEPGRNANEINQSIH